MAEDKFKELPHLTWRGITLPIAERGHRFAHEGTDHQIIYRNGVAVEMTGAGARVFSYTLPMRDGITKGPYKFAFTSTLRKLWLAYHDDKSPGVLSDPIYGDIVCVPQEWDETTDVSKRDGVDVRVSFKEHIPVNGTAKKAAPSLDSLSGKAKRLDDAVKKTKWPVQQPPPKATASPLAIASGIIQQGNFAVSRSKAQVHEVAMRMGEVEDAAAEAEKNGAPGMGVIRRDARNARLDATKVANAPPRDAFSEVVQVVSTAPRDLFETAKALGLSVQDLIYLNPGLARNPKVEPGTRIWTRQGRR